MPHYTQSISERLLTWTTIADCVIGVASQSRTDTVGFSCCMYMHLDSTPAIQRSCMRTLRRMALRSDNGSWGGDTCLRGNSPTRSVAGRWPPASYQPSTGDRAPAPASEQSSTQQLKP